MTRSRLKVIDLFSGLGGFSQAFVDRGHYVTRYDFNPEFEGIPHTIIRDVFSLKKTDLEGADIILASIDCTYFTYANAQPDKEGLELSYKLAKHTITIIKDAEPRYYVIENPPGRIKNVLGIPMIITAWGYWGKPYLKPTWLWGNIPGIEWKTRYTEPEPKDTWDLSRYKHNKFSYLCDSDPKKRSIVPYDFSLALCSAVENNSSYQEVLE